ncbi:MAG: hypothetical protein KDA25_05430 [Phycisphaerales bacterium]|nr:hypothetical protein [Phycisphaerales bacterium]
MMVRHASSRRGTSLVGILVSMVIIMVLSVILLTSLNKATTGAGNPVAGTVRSFQDELYLGALYQSMAVAATDRRTEGFIMPSAVARSGDDRLNTTANLFSLMVMQRYTPPKQLISGNEYSPVVDEDLDYDFTRYDPSADAWWDPGFTADLRSGSNVSFAHVPLCFNRRDYWAWADSRVPIIGNRGPANGEDDPSSYTYGRAGVWGGHLLHGDGHIVFVDSFVPSGLSYRNASGEWVQDNLFAEEDGIEGLDAILAFTRSIDLKDGPELQWD